MYIYCWGKGEFRENEVHEQKAWDSGVGDRCGGGRGGGFSVKGDLGVRRDVGQGGARDAGELEAGDDLRPWNSDRRHCQRPRKLHTMRRRPMVNKC